MEQMKIISPFDSRIRLGGGAIQSVLGDNETNTAAAQSSNEPRATSGTTPFIASQIKQMISSLYRTTITA